MELETQALLAQRLGYLSADLAEVLLMAAAEIGRLPERFVQLSI